MKLCVTCGKEIPEECDSSSCLACLIQQRQAEAQAEYEIIYEMSRLIEEALERAEWNQ